MPEQIRRYISVEDIKLMIAVVSLLVAGFLSLNSLENKVNELSVRSTVDDAQDAKTAEAIQDLVVVTQDLSVVVAKVEVRLKNLETVLPAFRRGGP